MLNDDIARSIARAINESRFERQGYDAKANAQRNLQGKTHYVDAVPKATPTLGDILGEAMKLQD